MALIWPGVFPLLQTKAQTVSVKNLLSSSVGSGDIVFPGLVKKTLPDLWALWLNKFPGPRAASLTAFASIRVQGK